MKWNIRKTLLQTVIQWKPNRISAFPIQVRNRILTGLLMIAGLKAGSLPEPIMYVHPLPDSRFHSTQTTIILKLSSGYRNHISNLESLIRVKGTRSYSGSTFFAQDHKTIIFRPDQFFMPNETVTVTIALSQVDDTNDFVYSFSTADNQAQLPKESDDFNDSVSLKKQPNRILSDEVRIINGVAVPSDFPVITTRQPGTTEPGLIFYATNYPTTSGDYLIICKNDGTPYYYRNIPDVIRSGNFLLHANGWLSAHLYDQRGRSYWRNLVFDSTFTLIDVYRPGHGYETDNHELQFLANGHALINAHQVVKMDLSNYIPGGRSSVNVEGMHFQELDQDKNVIFEWRGWDHYDIKDAVKENLTGGNIDYIHLNSIDIDYDSNYVVSCRNLEEVTKINRNTGRIMWRLGGVNNQFEHINDDVMISYQHDARPVRGKPDHYLIFDNGRMRNPHFSRAVEYELDTLAMTAKVVWQYRYTPDRRVGGMGSSQRLPGGNTLIDWPLSRTNICEVTPEGEIVFELFSEGHTNYRCRRFNWYGKMKIPYLQVENHGYYIRLFFNKFGDSDVDHYNIYAGTEDNPSTFLASTSQTYYDVMNPVNQAVNYYRVTAVNHYGEESEFSETQNSYVQFIISGQNAVLNGTFGSFLYWIFVTDPSASATRTLTSDRECMVHVESGSLDQVRLYQNKILLLQGKTYVFEFDAYGSTTGIIDAVVEKKEAPNTNYGKIGSSYITKQKQHFRYTFEMEDLTDNDARVIFKCGDFTGDLYLDNVSLVYTGSESGQTVRINFQPDGIETPAGYLADTGAGYESHSSGFSYGWLDGPNGETRYRDTAKDIRFATLNHMQKSDPRTWEIALMNGEYNLHLVMGDPSNTDQINDIQIENITLKDTDGEDYFDEYTVTVQIQDGRLTLSPASTSMNAKLCFIDISSGASAIIDDSAQPAIFALVQNAPNPFNPETVIRYRIKKKARVSLQVFNIHGQKVAQLVDTLQNPGTYAVCFDGSGLASGIYCYRLRSGKEVITRRMVLMK